MKRQERAIAERLAQNFGRVTRREALIDELYGDDPEGGPLVADGILKVVVSTLRRRIAPAGLVIVAEWGTGYRMQWAASVHAAGAAVFSEGA